MPRRIIGSVAAVVLVTLALSSCSAAGPESDERTIDFVTYDNGEKYPQLIEAFEEAYPDITVNLEILAGDDTYNTIVNSRLSGGSAPDIFQVLNQDLQPFVDAGAVVDLGTEEWVDRQVDAVTALSTTYDGTYAFVPELSTAGVFYNVEMFESAGLEIPTTWDEFLATIAAFRATGVTPLAVGAKDGWPFLVQFNEMLRNASEPDEGAGLDSGELPWSESSAQTVLTDFAAMVKAQSFAPDASGVDWPASAAEFASGNAAMMIQGSFAVPSVRETSPDGNFGLFPLPYVEQGEEAPVFVQPAAMLAVPVTAPDQETAKLFLDFWSQSEQLEGYLTTAQALSAYGDATGELDPILDYINELLPTRATDVSTYAIGSAATNSAVQSGMQAILVGSSDVEGVLAQLDAAQAAG